MLTYLALKIDKGEIAYQQIPKILDVHGHIQQAYGRTHLWKRGGRGFPNVANQNYQED